MEFPKELKKFRGTTQTKQIKLVYQVNVGPLINWFGQK